MESLLVDITAAGEILGIKKTTAYRWAATGELPGIVWIGGGRRVYLPALKQALEERASANKESV